MALRGKRINNSIEILWNGSSKIQFVNNFGTFSVGGCWGQSMLLFWKLVRETQMSKHPKATKHHNSTKMLMLLHLRAIYFSTFQYETPFRKSQITVGKLNSPTANIFQGHLKQVCSCTLSFWSAKVRSAQQ